MFSARTCLASIFAAVTVVAPTAVAYADPPNLTTPWPSTTSMNALAAWINEGIADDPANFHDTLLDGVPTPLSSEGDVAFRQPGTVRGRESLGCISSKGMLTCMPPLSSPVRKPTKVVDHWVGNWMEFDGSTITVGGIHGDPGVFIDGSGKPLAFGHTLAFGDYKCRSDLTGMYCVNLPKRTGFRFSNTITPYGCTQVEVPRGSGAKFKCAGA